MATGEGHLIGKTGGIPRMRTIIHHEGGQPPALKHYPETLAATV